MQIIGQEVTNQLNETCYKHPFLLEVSNRWFQILYKIQGHPSLLDIHGRVSFQNTNEQICKLPRVHKILKNQEKDILIPH